MKKLFIINGFTLIEVILTISVLGIVIVPLMSIVVLCAKINKESNNEYKSFLEAQKYMEEIKATKSIDYTKYIYNAQNGSYEATVPETSDKFGATIKVIPQKNLLLLIEVNIIDDGIVVNSINGSKVIP